MAEMSDRNTSPETFFSPVPAVWYSAERPLSAIQRQSAAISVTSTHAQSRDSSFVQAWSNRMSGSPQACLAMGGAGGGAVFGGTASSAADMARARLVSY